MRVEAYPIGQYCIYLLTLRSYVGLIHRPSSSGAILYETNIEHEVLFIRNMSDIQSHAAASVFLTCTVQYLKKIGIQKEVVPRKFHRVFFIKNRRTHTYREFNFFVNILFYISCERKIIRCERSQNLMSFVTIRNSFNYFCHVIS